MRRRELAWIAAVACSVLSLFIPRATHAPVHAVGEAAAASTTATDVVAEATAESAAAASAPAPASASPDQLAAAIGASAVGERPTHVVIISEDGLRPDALTDELTPRHMALMREATVARYANTIPQSDTLPSHAAMLSGFGAREHGLRWNSFQPRRGYIHVPTIFSIAEDAGLSTAMIVGKTKLRHIAPRGKVGHFERPSYLCGGVAARAASYFVDKQPTILFVHFSDPDEYGHSHGWMSREYLRAVQNSDRCLGSVLDAIDHSELAESTLVIVTADHGGHGRHHSHGRDDVDRQIPWIARGPGAGEHTILDAPMTTMDTAATVLAALGLAPSPGMQGVARLSFGP